MHFQKISNLHFIWKSKSRMIQNPDSSQMVNYNALKTASPPNTIPSGINM